MVSDAYGAISGWQYGNEPLGTFTDLIDSSIKLVHLIEGRYRQHEKSEGIRVKYDFFVFQCDFWRVRLIGHRGIGECPNRN